MEENTVRKFKWTKHKIYETYDDANTERESLASSGNQFLKIRRCGPGGSRFKVLIGSKIGEKKAPKKNSKGKKWISQP